MRSSRLAILALTLGSGLLGFSTVGVTAVSGHLPQSASDTVQHPRPHDHGSDGGHGHRGV
jgi:hypothetical protein